MSDELMQIADVIEDEVGRLSLGAPADEVQDRLLAQVVKLRSSVREEGDGPSAQDVIDALRIGLLANANKTIAQVQRLVDLAPPTDGSRSNEPLLRLLKEAPEAA